MIILKTTTLVFGLFGLNSFNVNETRMVGLPECKAYLVAQQHEFANPKFKTTLKFDGMYLDTQYENWPWQASLLRECIEVK